MDVEQFKQDVAAGSVSLDRLVDLIVSQQKLIDELQKQNAELQKKIDSKKNKERIKGSGVFVMVRGLPSTAGREDGASIADTISSLSAPAKGNKDSRPLYSLR